MRAEVNPCVDVPAAVRAQMGRPPERIGIAFSGGGDSVALLHAVRAACRDHGTELFAATVDHGLRADSAAEARQAAEIARQAGARHTILTRGAPPPGGNMQGQAREARYTMLCAWARQNDIPLIAVAHTADDQAETLLMRLARGSGVAGLSCMAPRHLRHGVTIWRPLLGVRRQDLRAYLRSEGVDWIEDPSNQDHRFERIRMRTALEALAPLGLTAERLSEVAANMQSARESVDWYTFLAAREAVVLDAGNVVLDRRAFRTFPREIARQLLQHAVCWISGAIYPLRRAAMERFAEAARAGQSITTGGVQMLTRGERTWIFREYERVRSRPVPVGRTWDDRWIATGSGAPGAELRAIGPEGLAQCPNWRATGRPRSALLAAPGVWEGDRLAAAPAAGRAGTWSVRALKDDEAFFSSILSH